VGIKSKFKNNKDKSKSRLISVLPPDAVIQHHLVSLNKVIGSWIKSKKVPGSILITGCSGVGKRSMVHYLSQWLLCENSPFAPEKKELQEGLLLNDLSRKENVGKAKDRPCQTCSACQRAVNGNWIDFQEISPEISDTGKIGSIKIDRFRELQSTQGFGSYTGTFKIILISNAERMTVQAANSLLKILEEPPPGWILILTASDESLLLPTLVSRCQKIRLKPFPEKILKEILSKSDTPRERHFICTKLAQGSWKRAITLAGDEHWEQRQNLFRFLESPQSEITSLVDKAAQNVENFQNLINSLEEMTHDLILWSLSHEGSVYSWVNLDGQAALIRHARAKTENFGNKSKARAFWIDCNSRLEETRREMNAPLNKKVLMQNLLMPWL